MHAGFVLEHLDSQGHRWLIADNRPRLPEMPGVSQADAAEMTFPGSPIKRYAAGDAEWFLQQPNLPDTSRAIGYSLAPRQAVAAGKTALGKENIKE